MSDDDDTPESSDLKAIHETIDDVFERRLHRRESRDVTLECWKWNSEVR